MTGEERELDGVALGGQRVGQRSHGLGVAGEAVQHEHAVRTTVVGERLGAGNDGSGHVEMLGQATPRTGRVRGLATDVAGRRSAPDWAG